MASPNPAHEKLVYIQDGVFLQTSKCHRDERGLLMGRVTILEGKHGAFITWEPTEKQKVTESGDSIPVSSASGVVFRNRGSGSVTVPVTDNHPRPFRYELSELSSYRTGDEDHSMVLVMRDGSTSNSLMFQGDSMDNFVRALTKYLKIKRSKRDRHLFLVKDVREDALSQSLNPMDIFDGLGDIRGSGPALIRGLISNVNGIRNDPKTAAMTAFSKLYNVVNDTLLGFEEMGDSRPTDEVSEVLQQSLSPSTSFEDVTCSKTSGVSSVTDQGFEVIEAYNVSMPPLRSVTRGEPLTRREWESDMVDVDGRVIEPDLVKERVFRGGVEPSLRKDVWKYLLGVIDWNMTSNQIREREKKNLDYYYRMKFQWKSITEDQEARFSGYRDRKSLIEKDVNRTDRTHPFYQGDNNQHVEMLSDILMSYVMYNFDLGYVQGMSDLLSPILYVMGDEVDAFWCFKGFIGLVHANFDLDQEGMKRQLHDLQQLLSVIEPKFLTYLEGKKSGQLYFLFRWLLIWFKREFSFEGIQRLWEVFWTGLPCKNFYLLFCVALLQTARHTITENDFGFNEILKHVNDMSMKIDVEDNLCKAEALYHQLREATGVPEVVRLILDLPRNEVESEAETDGATGILPEPSPAHALTSSSDTDEKCDRAMSTNFL